MNNQMNRFVFGYLFCSVLWVPGFALAHDPVMIALQDKALTATVSEQYAAPEESPSQKIQGDREIEGNEGQDTISSEDQYLKKLDEMTVEVPDDEGDIITYDVPVVVNDRVEAFIKYFQTRGRWYFEQWLARSQRYLPMIKEILKQNDIPEDLAYLALIESGFNPNARSRARAVGMWQFMKWTGKKYGLKIDLWVDERRDPEKATWAAAKYLKDLYNIFNSWHLAAASYNAGEGRVLRAIKKHKTDDYWVVIKRKWALKRETRDYIPKYIAALLIAKEPDKYGFTDIEYHPQLSYEKVTISGATDLRVIAKACECSADDIKELNPQLLRWFTPPNYSDYEIRLPAGKAEIFKANFAAVPPEERLNFLVHRIKKGETLSLIAKKYRTSVESILYLNKLKNARFVRAGTEIVVPVRSDGKSIKEIATPKTISPRRKS